MASAENTSSHSTNPIGSSAIAVDVDKPSSPYFLPSAENPGIILVSQPLTAENYLHCSRSMTKALSAMNKLGFVDGSIPEPSDPDSPLFQAWWRCNDMVFSWIINALSRNIACKEIYSDKANEIWMDLKEEYVLQFLMGLNETFSNVRVQILLMEPILSINKVFSLIQQEEKQKSVGLRMTSVVESAVLATRFENTFGYGSNSSSHGSNYKGEDWPICSHCGLKGHTVDKCYRVHDFPPGYRNRGKGQAHQDAAIMVPNQSSISENSTLTLTQAQIQCQELMKHVNILSSQFAEIGNNAIDHQSMTRSSTLQAAHVVIQSAPLYPQSSTFAAFDHTGGEFHGSTISLEHSVFSANFTPPSTISSQDWILDTEAIPELVLPTQTDLRKSNRVSKPPSYLLGYHHNLTSNLLSSLPTPQYPIFDTLSYSKLTTTHRGLDREKCEYIEDLHVIVPD
nr:uncharacterized protein LOC111998447 [Quercus suber]